MKQTITRRLAALVLAVVLCLAVVPAAHAADTAGSFPRVKTYTDGMFTDVSSSAWYAQSVKNCYEFGLMQGRSDTAFAPSGMFTIAEALTVASRIHNLYNGGDGKLPASTGKWYQSAVDYALSHGLIKAATFDSYEKNITRAEMAELVANALPAACWAAINSVTELPDVSPAVAQSAAIFKLYNAGVFGGSDDYGTFHPYAFIVRAEVAAILSRCVDPALRLTLHLTPLSQRQAPVITDNGSPSPMSCGLMRWQDPATGLYGYMDGTCKVAIPAVYTDAADFVEGYAWVRGEAGWGMIDTRGNVVVPLQFDVPAQIDCQSYESRHYSKSERVLEGRGGRAGLYAGWQSDSRGYALIVDGKQVTKAIFSELAAVNNDLILACSSDTGLRGVINTKGRTVVDFKYKKIIDTDHCIFGINPDGTADVFDLSGVKIISDSECKYAMGSPLFAVKRGAKWALAGTRGLITDFLYDSITLYEDAALAALHYGTQQALAGEIGIIFDLGVCEVQSALGSYATILKLDDDLVWLADATGLQESWLPDETGELRGPAFANGDYISEITKAVNGSYLIVRFNKTSWNESIAFYIWDASSHILGYRGSSWDSIEDGIAYTMQDGSGFLSDGKRFLSTETEGEFYATVPSYSGLSSVTILIHRYCTYQTEDGKYGLWVFTIGEKVPVREGWNEFRTDVLPAIYDTAEDAVNAYIVYRIVKENGKPMVVRGNDVIGFTPVIQYYKNNFYYDEIQDLGEGYYACRFDTTWYLLHA